MREQGFVSWYTVAQFKLTRSTYNESKQANELNRQFSQDEALKVAVSDLTYVRVKQRWHYICILVNLYNREMIGYSAGSRKDAPLVYRAFSKIPYNLNQIQLFHTDRGHEFKNKFIDQALETLAFVDLWV